MGGGRNLKERQAAVRAYTEEAVREGLLDSAWDRLVGGVVLGSAEFARKVSQGLKANPREQSGVRKILGSLRWEQIVKAVETIKGEAWEQFRDRHGDWGRDAALWLGRRVGRLRLRELAERAGGIDYASAGGAVSRFGRRLQARSDLRGVVARIERHLSNAEM